jgi:hypothetical protein
MARTSDDLKALLMAADTYTETVEIHFMGERFAVQIRPLTEMQLTEVSRNIRLSKSLLQGMAKKAEALKNAKKNPNLSKEDEEKLAQSAVDEMLSGDGSELIEMGDLNYANFIQEREYCKFGIVDKGLAQMVTTFRYGLTEKLADRIKTISEVPPEAVANFFGVSKAKPSS